MKLKLRFLNIFFTLILCFAFSACSDDAPKHNNRPEEPESTVARRTVLVYMISNNSLGRYGYDSADIKEMKNGIAAGQLPSDARWLIYLAPYFNETPKLLELDADGLTTLKEYEPAQSATYSRMCEVLDDMAAFAPAEKYGLILWSHGTSWIVNGLQEDLPDDPYAVRPLSFGDDNNAKMNVSTLRAAVKGRNIDYMYFDACYMTSVEVAYELRDATDYIIGSPSELPSEGMPYHLNMAPLADGSPDALVQAATNTFNLFDDYRGYERTCTMSVIATEPLVRLAKATSAIYSLTPLSHPADYRTNYRVNGLQVDAFDFGEYVRALAEDSGLSDELLDEFDAALDAAVLYAAATPYLWGSRRIYNATGMSTYIFNSSDEFSKYSYPSLQWAQDVAIRHLEANL